MNPVIRPVIADISTLDETVCEMYSTTIIIIKAIIPAEAPAISEDSNENFQKNRPDINADKKIKIRRSINIIYMTPL
jgi:hypothetical protein